jgi:uncharacterized protein YcbX
LVYERGVQDRPHIGALYIYPIKSLAGVSVLEAEVTDRGFRYDRRMMLVDPTGRFVTLRELPALATLGLELEDGAVRLSAADMEDLQVPLHSEGDGIPVQIWRSRVAAVPVGPEADAWFSQAMERPLRLVYMPERAHRDVNPVYAPEGAWVSFADGYPYLAVTQSALDELSVRVGHTMSARRFRPNIVIADARPFAEDNWGHFVVGKVRFRGVKPCDRCVVVTQDPDTGMGGTEPLAALAKYRKRDGHVYFGQNLLAEGEGTVEVGMEIRVEGEAA